MQPGIGANILRQPKPSRLFRLIPPKLNPHPRTP